MVGTMRQLDREVKRMTDRAGTVKEQGGRLLTKLKLSGRAVVERGAVAATILEHANRRGLVIVGHRSLDALDRALLGSASSRVVVEAPCPVLVTKQPARPLRRILLATDGSQPAKKALHFLTTEIAPAARSRIEVLVCHVMPYLRFPEVKAVGEAVIRAAADKLLKAGFRVVEVPRLGNPAQELLTAASRHGADLIVVGPRGLGQVKRWFLGSVSTKLLQLADASVLVVR
jgi:nucleotide-binding universal stress UspA family protein